MFLSRSLKESRIYLDIMDPCPKNTGTNTKLPLSMTGQFEYQEEHIIAKFKIIVKQQQQLIIGHLWKII